MASPILIATLREPGNVAIVARSGTAWYKRDETTFARCLKRPKEFRDGEPEAGFTAARERRFDKTLTSRRDEARAPDRKSNIIRE